jgi:chromate transporter
MSNVAPPITSPERARPTSRTDLFWSFTWLALQGFGGVLVVVQRELVDKKKWLTREEFVEEWAVAQVMPGPNVVNLGLMMGGRYFGPSGALVAMAGLLLFPLIIVLVLASLFTGIADMPQAQGALRGMSAVAAGLITGTGLKLVPALKTNVMGIPLSVLVAVVIFIAIAMLRLPLVWVLLAVGVIACMLAYRRLGSSKP